MEKKTTVPAAKLIVSVLTSQWVAGPLLDEMTDFVSNDLNLGAVPMQIRLSDWIQRLEDGNFFGIKLSSEGVLRLIVEGLKLARKIVDSCRTEQLRGKVEAHCPTHFLYEMLHDQKNRNLPEINGRGEKLLRNFNFEGKFDALELLAAVKAIQTEIRCRVRYKVPLMKLIRQSQEGDRQAVLDLVKLEKLFLMDPCTQEVLRKAHLENDERFLHQLARAELYRRDFTRRDACAAYLHLLFGLGTKLPTVARLRMVVDPKEGVFKGQYAFDKFYELHHREPQSPFNSESMSEMTSGPCS